MATVSRTLENAQKDVSHGMAKYAIQEKLLRRQTYLSLRTMASDTRAPTKGREKVAIKPGFHLVDWMRLMQASTNFDTRNGGPPRRVSRAELKEHKSEFDCWTAYQGKVYNITQYLHYHPGGGKYLMAGAGKDCTKEFDKFHKWVNIDNMLAKCYIGPLMDDAQSLAEEDEEEDEDEDEGKSEGKEEIMDKALELLDSKEEFK